MFNATANTQTLAFQSACDRFAALHNITEVAQAAGINPQVLRNKLNADQPHQLTVRDLITLYQVTGDETLLDGALLDCGLTAVRLPGAEEQPHLVSRAIELNAAVSGLGVHALQVTSTGRVTKGQRNTIVGVATAAMGELAILINEVENKFQSMPVAGCCVDALRTMAGV